MFDCLLGGTRDEIGRWMRHESAPQTDEEHIDVDRGAPFVHGAVARLARIRSRNLVDDLSFDQVVDALA
jgi:hypothetical protein